MRPRVPPTIVALATCLAVLVLTESAWARGGGRGGGGRMAGGSVRGSRASYGGYGGTSGSTASRTVNQYDRGSVSRGEYGTAVQTDRGTAVRTDQGITYKGEDGQVRHTNRDDLEVRRGEDGTVVMGENGYVVKEKGEKAEGRRYGEHYDDHYDHDDDDYNGWGAAAAVLGAAVIMRNLPYGYETVYHDGAPYYYSGDAYYQEVYYEGDVAYQQVPPPVGAVVATLPGGCNTAATAAGETYYDCAGTYYVQVSSGYQVIQPPPQ
jgi:hypothetical protein